MIFKKTISFLFSVLILALPAMAQTPPPGGSTVGAPLDGFVAALLVVAVVFAVWKFKKSTT